MVWGGEVRLERERERLGEGVDGWCERWERFIGNWGRIKKIKLEGFCYCWDRERECKDEWDVIDWLGFNI